MDQTWYQYTSANTLKNDYIVEDQSKYDVLIVGAGLAGLSLLYHLRRGGVNALIVEAKSVGNGASGRNGGFCLSGWAQDYDVLLKYLSSETVQELEKIAKVEQLPKLEGI